MQISQGQIRASFERFFSGPETEDGEQRMFCPICEDPDTSHSPSAMMNVSEGVWNCLKGNHGGKITDLVSDLKRERGFRVVRSEPRTASSRPKTEPPNPAAVAAWNEALLDGGEPFRRFVRERGLDEQTIEDYEIGWDQRTARYTIPVYDADGDLVNVRKYKLGCPDNQQKFLNHPGWGEARLYVPRDFSESSYVILAEGELDCLVLNQMGFFSASGTGGSKTFKSQWAEAFTDKTVFVAYDADDAGVKGAAMVANALQNFALAVYRVPLPTPGSDVTDFFVKERRTPEEFEELMDKAERAGNMASREPSTAPQEGTRVSLIDSMSDKYGSDPLELVVSITGKQSEPYTAPRKVVATCDMSKGAACETCPVMARQGEMKLETQPNNPMLVEFVDVGSDASRRLLRALMGARCNDRVQFDVEQHWRVEELAVQQSVDERRDEESEKPVRRTVLSIGTYSTETNAKMRLVGCNVPDPKTGALRFMAWKNDQVDLDIDNVKLTPQLREALEAFRPERGQSPLDRCLEIAADMAFNVTGIIGRNSLHVGFDLVWHSPIAFRVNDRDVDKGWLEMFVIGDTRTGKSEIAQRLMQHYMSGRLVSCEGVTFAGLIGGVQQINGRWHMTWGAIPMNDRRLVVLDEVSGMAEKGVIEQMSSVRSAGIAQVTKIAAESTSARTRLIWISNPQDGRFLAENPKRGVGAIQTVIPNPEDIARFDFVMAAARGDVSAEDINADRQPGPPEFDSESCEMLVKWAWSLTRDDVTVSEAAFRTASRLAVQLGRRYTPNPPLVQAENVRYKLLRIAAAIAARTFSVGRKGNLLVNRVHVEDAMRFLDMIYNEDSLGYGRMSNEEEARSKKAEDYYSNAKQLMLNQPEIFRTLQMNGEGRFRVRDFTEFQGMEETAASRVCSILHDWGMVRYEGRGVFAMTEKLNRLIKDMESVDID